MDGMHLHAGRISLTTEARVLRLAMIVSGWNPLCCRVDSRVSIIADVLQLSIEWVGQLQPMAARLDAKGL